MTMYPLLGILLMGLVHAAEVWGRDNSKIFKSMPAISNSLVNLGKMDISFHFNTKTPIDAASNSLKSDRSSHTEAFFMNSKSDHELEPCPCSSLKNFNNPIISKPSNILNRIFKSNDLFSVNQEPTVSTMCCDSHEHVQEDTIYFEFSPKTHSNSFNGQNIPLPAIENFFPKSAASSGYNKQKAIEIFFFPKKNEGASPTFDISKLIPSTKKKETVKKSDITIVGDKELRNDFKHYKFRPTTMVKEEEHEKVIKEKDGKETNMKLETTPVYYNIDNSTPTLKIESPDKDVQVSQSASNTL